VPVRITGMIAPCAPVAGAMEVCVGGGALTVNTAGPLVPLGVVTVTSAAPRVAFGATVNIAASVVSLHVRSLTVTPGVLTDTLHLPVTNPVPVIDTGTLAPWLPFAGAIDAAVGTGAAVT